MFKHVDLGPHEERIRLRLIKDDPGLPSDYPCIVFPLFLDGDQCHILVEPTLVKWQGHKCYRFVFGGFVILYYVSSHRLPPSYERIILNTHKPMRFQLTELHEHKFLRVLWDRVAVSTKDVVTSFGT